MFAISSLNAGGAERVLSNMANFWARKGWAVSIVTLDDVSNDPFYPLDPRIKCIRLNQLSNSSNMIIGCVKNWQRVSQLRRTIRKNNPNVIISFIDTMNVLILLASLRLGIKVVVSERIDPKLHSIGYIWKLLRLVTYHMMADHIIVQTQRAKGYFPATLHSRVLVVPNAVTVDHEVRTTSLVVDAQKPCVISIGRLVEQKGFDVLISAFAKLKSKFPSWTLNIYGEGPLRSNLESLCRELEISSWVRFHGRIHNPYTVLYQANIFVLSSRFEGFPNVLLEAMACGLPVISTDCPSGPREIIQNGKNGILVPSENDEALANAMEWLMVNEVERQRLGICAKDVAQCFSADEIMKKWEEILCV